LQSTPMMNRSPSRWCCTLPYRRRKRSPASEPSNSVLYSCTCGDD
jgi:hypothetical protein